MNGLESSIKKTLSYAGYFHYPLDQEELHLWLIGDKQVSKQKLNSVHTQNLTSREKLLKEKLKKISLSKVISTQKIVGILSAVPTINLVAITGSVAIGNAKEMDDIDLLIVTQRNTLWLTRPLVLLLLSIVGKRRHPNASYLEAANSFCPNLWLENGSLFVPKDKQNLYTAHEVLQTMPIFDRGNTYQTFLHTNKWIKNHLANAFDTKSSKTPPDNDNKLIIFLLGLLFFPLNSVSYLVQHLYMKPKLTKETVTLNSAYFHKINFAKKIDEHFRINRVGYN